MLLLLGCVGLDSDVTKTEHMVLKLKLVYGAVGARHGEVLGRLSVCWACTRLAGRRICGALGPQSR